MKKKKTKKTKPGRRLILGCDRILMYGKSEYGCEMLTAIFESTDRIDRILDWMAEVKESDLTVIRNIRVCGVDEDGVQYPPKTPTPEAKP